jgi:hypothetical protein
VICYKMSIIRLYLNNRKLKHGRRIRKSRRRCEDSYSY